MLTVPLLPCCKTMVMRETRRMEMMRRYKEMMGTGNCAPLALLQDHGDDRKMKIEGMRRSEVAGRTRLWKMMENPK